MAHFQGSPVGTKTIESRRGEKAVDFQSVLVEPYGISGAEQVRRFSANVSRCDFGSQGSTSWPPKKPILVKLTGWSAEKFRAEAFVPRFKDWRWPLSTFLRDPWLTFVGRQGDLLPSSTVDVSLEEYLELRNTTGRNIFLFLRDELQDDEGHGRAGLRHRFFQALEGELAPLFRTKLRIFAMDGLAAGHGMHRHKEAWLASLAGRKLWWVAPPHESSTLHGRPSFPYKDLTAEEGGWPCSWLLQEELVPPGVFRCVQNPGEVVVLPAQWWHMTCSLDEFNIAMGGQEA
eukprot:symbB.v1.2.003855.t1/scaffold213.1/size264521/10